MHQHCVVEDTILGDVVLIIPTKLRRSVATECRRFITIQLRR